MNRGYVIVRLLVVTCHVVVRRQQHRERRALLGGAPHVGNFDESQWGISASAVSKARRQQGPARTRVAAQADR